MTDNILRLLTVLGLGALFTLVVIYTNLMVFNVDEDRTKSNLMIGSIGLIVGFALFYEYELQQGFSPLLVKGVMVGSAFLFIVNGGNILYISNREAQIIVMGIILAMLLYGSTFV